MRTPFIAAYLATVPAVVALAADRFYPDDIPEQSSLDTTREPCVVYARTSVETQQLFEGEDALVRITMQVDSYGAAYDDAEALADAVKKALVGYSGPMGPVYADTIQVETESQPGPDPEPGLYRVFQSFNFWCREI